MDIARFLASAQARSAAQDDGQLAFEAFYSYLLPQFEGIDQVEGENLYKASGNSSESPGTSGCAAH